MVRACLRAGGAPTRTRLPCLPACLPLPACQMLQALGARVEGPQDAAFNGIAGLHLWPRVTWTPLFAASWDDLEARLGPHPERVHIGADAALVIASGGGGAPVDVRIESLDLQRGALVIGGSGGGGGDTAAPAAAAAAAKVVVVDDLVVDNAGWEWQALQPGEDCREEEYIRGFRVLRREQQTLP